MDSSSGQTQRRRALTWRGLAPSSSRATTRARRTGSASSLLTLGRARRSWAAAEAAGADFVKTSTGFHPAGGASTHAVALMRATVGDRRGVKASGGIRTAADALAMVEAGANRLGLSASAAVLEGLAD